MSQFNRDGKITQADIAAGQKKAAERRAEFEKIISEQPTCDSCQQSAPHRYSVIVAGTRIAMMVCFECSNKTIVSASAGVDKQRTENALMSLCVHPGASNFTSELMRLIQKADPENYRRLNEAFPDECNMYMQWRELTDEDFKRIYGMEKYQ